MWTFNNQRSRIVDLVLGGFTSNEAVPEPLQANLESILAVWGADTDVAAAAAAIRSASPGLAAGSSVTLADDSIDVLSDTATLTGSLYRLQTRIYSAATAATKSTARNRRCRRFV